MSMNEALKLIQIIIALAIFFQTVEYLLLQRSFKEKGIWRWSEIKTEFNFLPNYVQYCFDFLLRDRHFILLLWTRLITSLLFLFYPSFFLVFFLFVSSLLISQRFRGSFNGGSDYMSMIVLSSLSLEALIHRPLVTKGVLWYIALQSATSYFIAGLVKLKQKSWRNAEALTLFIQSPNYKSPKFVRSSLSNKTLSFFASWMVIILELSFPLVFMQPPSTGIIWLASGFLFHLINYYIFGLNRFLIVWLSTYPAIYFCLFT